MQLSMTLTWECKDDNKITTMNSSTERFISETQSRKDMAVVCCGAAYQVLVHAGIRVLREGT